MASTTFSNGTVVQPAWLNDVDLATYGVESFGATGDGTTDDTAAITSAIAALPNGGTLLFPSGTYVLQQITVTTPGIRFVGTGINATVLKLKDNQNTSFITFSGVNGGEFAHMTIDGNIANNAAMTDKGALLIAGSKNISAHDFHIKDYDGKGVTISSGTGGTVEDIHVSSFSVTNCNEQAVIVDATLGTAQRITIDNFTVYTSTHAGIAINDGATDVAVTNGVIDCNTTVWDAVALRNVKRVSITNVIGKRGRNGCYIQYDTAQCEDIVISSCIFDTNSQNGILILSAKRVTLANNIVRNNDQAAVGAAGINLSKAAAGAECSYININNCLAIDDQGIATQQYGYLIQNSPTKVLLSGCSATGNVTSAISIGASVAVGECLILPGHGVDMWDLLKWTVTSGHGNLIEFWRSGDTNARFIANQNGQLEWGTGAAARDVNLYRSGTNLLKTDDKLLASSGLGVGLSASGLSAQVATPSGNTSHKLAIYDDSNNLIGYIPVYAAPW